MTRTWMAIAGGAAILAVVPMVGATEHDKAAKKPLVSRAQIVETYKKNTSVDETSDALLVDQSVVAACLKAAGITPNEQDR